MLKFFTPIAVFAFLFASNVLFASASMPPNDSPCNPDYIGTLNAPGNCPVSNPNPNYLTSQSNVNSTPEVPHPALMNCLGLGNMPVQMRDVWYKFEASATVLNVLLNGTLNTPYVALYQYTGDCMGMIPINCAKGISGNLSASFSPLIPGAEYLLQVGNSTTETAGSYTLILSNTNDCNSCMQYSQLFVDPAPVNGFYNKGDTVNFCYVVSGYKRRGDIPQSLHGIVPLMDNGWQLLTSTSNLNTPQSVSGTGTWRWLQYPNITTIGTQWGFFYDTSSDGPQNNLGDSSGVNDMWIFCWQAIAKTTCTGNMSLNMKVYNFSDGETGNNTPSVVCNNDADYHFSAVLNCCDKLQVTGQNVTCGGNCDGSITAQILGPVLPPFSYYWYDSGGNLFDSAVNVTSSSDQITGLCEGSYSVVVWHGTPLCFSVGNVVIEPPFDINVTQLTSSCGSTGNHQAQVLVNPNVGNYSYLWMPTGQTSSIANGLSVGTTYTVTVTNLLNSCTATATILIEGLPPDDPFFQYPTDSICQMGMPVSPLYVASPGGTFSSSPPGLALGPSTGTVNPGLSSFGTYTVTYVTPGPCTATYVSSVTITTQDNPYFSYANNTICGIPLIPTYPDYVATYGGQFSVASGGCLVDPYTGAVSTTTYGLCSILYTTPNGGQCRDSLTVSLNFVPIPAAATCNPCNYTYCAGDTVSLFANVTGVGVIPAWFDSTGNPFYYTSPYTFIPTSGYYTFSVISFDLVTQCYNLFPAFITLTQATPPVANAGFDTIICPDGTATLTAMGGVAYSWSTGQTSQSISVSPLVTTVYTVTVTNNQNCTSVDFVIVFVDTAGCDTIDFIIDYNGITPNGDGYNDVWFINGISLKKNHVFIYNRWGDLVWDGHDYDNRNVVWEGQNFNGNKLPAGTYFYLIQLEGLPSKKGWVEITR